jgi:citrate synthase
MAAPTTNICVYDATDIFVRGENLCTDLIGKISLTDFIYLQAVGVRPTHAQRVVVESALVALAEHGLTPSVIAARLTYMGAPESLQGAVAAGILGVGDQFVGTVELVAPLLQEIIRLPQGIEAGAAEVVARHRAAKQLVPGFGQPHHKPDDPRPPALFEAARTAGVEGEYVEALRALGRHVDQALGRHMTINAPAAISALFLQIGVPVKLMRGLVVISRCIGLVGHLHEEGRNPVGRDLWKSAADAVGYEGSAPIGKRPAPK